MERHRLMISGSLAAVACLAGATTVLMSQPATEREPAPTLRAEQQTADVSPEPAPTVEPVDLVEQPLADLHVLLDPGHNSDNASHPEIVNVQVDDGRGGSKACNTTGTATVDGYPEYEFNYDVAVRMKATLEEAGATVSLTRAHSGVGPCVDERGKMAGEIQADVLISIHGNGTESPEPHGYFAVVSSDPIYPPQGEPSTLLAEYLSAGLDAEGFTPSTSVGPLMYRSDLATINHSTVPVVMLELTEFRNPDEAIAIQNHEVRQRYADGLSQGLSNWWIEPVSTPGE